MANFKEDILLITTRLIVEEGFNYAEAKQKAGTIVRPNKRQRAKSSNFPTNVEIERSVKDYLETFYWEELNLRLHILHGKAMNLMSELKVFAPILIGELSKSIATAFTVIRICVFSDSSKNILIHFLDNNIKSEILQLKHPFNRGSVEGLALIWEDHEAILYCLKNSEKNLCSKGISLNMLQQVVTNKVRNE